MARTVRRQPFSVSTKSSDYPTVQTFTQSIFSGINENENQMTVDQNSFADAKNVYIDRDGALVNRPPFVSLRSPGYIKTWSFGSHLLAIHKQLCYRAGVDEYHPLEDNDPGGHIESDLFIKYELCCIMGRYISDQDQTPDKLSRKVWYLPIGAEPKIVCARFSRGIFCWFNGTDIVLFDTDVDGKGFFTDGAKYLYSPVYEIVTNGLVSKGEGRNLFLDGYRRRYLLSTTSAVDFNEMQQITQAPDYKTAVTIQYKDKYGSSVSLKNSVPKDLLNSDGRILIHPKQPSTQDYLFTTRITPRGHVILRCSRDAKYIAVSFGFGPYHTLPVLANIIGEPTLTDDGFYAVAFTTDGLAFCKLVRSESGDFDVDDGLMWELEPYEKDVVFVDENDKRVCTGHFISREDYAYTAPHEDGSYLYAKSGDTLLVEYVDLISSLQTQQSRIWLNVTTEKQIQTILVRNTYEPYEYIGELMYLFYDNELGLSSGKQVLRRVGSADVSFPDLPQPFANLFGAHATISVTKAKDTEQYVQNIVLHVSEDHIAVKYIITITNSTNGVTVSRENLIEDSLYWIPIQGTTDVFSEEYYLPGGEFTNNNINIPRIPTPTRPLQNGDVVEVGSDYFRLFNISGNTLGRGELRAGDIIVVPPTCRTEAEILNMPLTKSNRWTLRKIDTSDTSFYFEETVEFVGQAFNEFPAGATFSGKLHFTKVSYVPLFGTYDGIWFHTPSGIWTSALEDGELIEIDVHVRPNKITPLIPELAAPLDDVYFSFVENGKPMLGVTSPRRADDGLNDLLYADADEVQSFVRTITNLHPLSDDALGIFTEDEVWYVTRKLDDTNSVVHTRPVRGRIPFGCKPDADVITALDGQAVIFATPRGIVALAPQDFVATTDKSLTFLSDNIDKTYRRFFDDTVKIVGGELLSSVIKICAYQYWLFFYRYMDREILLLDTRNSSWWKWTTPYPIRKLEVILNEVMAMFDITFSKTGDYVNLRKSQFGAFFLLDRSYQKEVYEDDIVAGALSGDYDYSYGNEYIRAQLVQHKAEPAIDWYFVSQRLHLNAPQNYKGITAVSLSVRGDTTMQAKFITKVYRDTFHPRREETQEILVNETRTFIERVNLQHVISFQYTIMNDEFNRRLRLDSLGVKYEVKEKIR